MRVQTFLCVMALYGVLAFCCVQETARQARLRYRLARVLREEETLRLRVEDLRAREMTLLGTTRLTALNDRRDTPLVPMPSWR